jgi:LPPG:FO 2-phospho-L-lactate transferase
MLRLLGGADQPAIGDRSLAAPLLRTHQLAENRRLTEITLDFCRELGIGARVLPMSDERVRTNVITDDGAVSFTEYFQELGCEPPVRGFQYAGIEDARISDEVRDALLAPDLEAIIIGPANPYHAIKPILEVPDMRELMRKRGAPIIAVTPLVGGKALKGSAGKMMRELGKEPSVRAVAGEYLRLIDGFVIDREDEIFAESVRSLGIAVRPTATVMRNANDRIALAQSALDFAAGIRATRSWKPNEAGTRPAGQSRRRGACRRPRCASAAVLQRDQAIGGIRRRARPRPSSRTLHQRQQLGNGGQPAAGRLPARQMARSASRRCARPLPLPGRPAANLDAIPLKGFGG